MCQKFVHHFINSTCLFFSLLVSLSGDVEVNPGPDLKQNEALSICHLNFNSISAHNFAKLHLLKAYVAVHKFDIICLSETYLDSSIPFDDNNLEISGYNLIHSDHPTNCKHGGVYIYYKKFLPLGVCDINLLDRQMCKFRVKIGDKLCRLVALYRSPSQTQDDFLSFSQNFELTLETLSKNKPYVLVATGDFNAKLTHWYSQDTNTFKGISVENVVSQFGLHQIIKEPTHILENSSSCIDLVFTSQPNLIVDSGTHPHYIQTVTIKLFTQNLILKSIIPHLILVKFDTIKIQIMILSEEQLISSTGKELLTTKM